MAKQRVSKVEAKQIEKTAAWPGARASQDAEAGRVTIDLTILSLLKSLVTSDDKESFEDRIMHFSQRIGSNLKAVRATLSAKDSTRLESLACELSTNALMVGAVRILSSSYELQNAARLGDWSIAETLADQLDMEFFWAQDGLKEAAALK